jgi:uncharacterized membrane protein YagU involved in acid resistance
MVGSIFFAVLIGGLIAGTIDIGAAALINRADPLLICRFIARGLIGKAALQGGAPATALGVALQWLMSIIIAAIYGLASGKSPILTRHWLACGLAYGVIVFFVMNYVVVPLSAVRKVPHFTVLSFSENMLAMLLFGLIIAYAIHRGALQTGVAAP